MMKKQPQDYCLAGKIIVANSGLLEMEQSRSSLKVCKSDDGKWTITRSVWVSPEYRTIDEADDDVGGGYFEEQKLTGAVFDDVHRANDVKSEIIYLVRESRNRACPYEHALAAANEDLQADYIGYGEKRVIGYHTDRYL